MIETRQAQLPTVPGQKTLLERMVKAQKLNVSPAYIHVTNSVIVANQPTNPALRELDDVAIRSIQNANDKVVYVGIGFVPSQDPVSGWLYHFALGAASGTDTGDGGFKDLSNIKGAVYIVAATGTPRVATFEAIAPEGNISNTPQLPPVPE